MIMVGIFDNWLLVTRLMIDSDKISYNYQCGFDNHTAHNLTLRVCIYLAENGIVPGILHRTIAGES